MENEIKNETTYEFNTMLGSAFTMYSDFMLDAPFSQNEIQKYLKNPLTYNSEIRKLAWWSYHSNGSVSSAIDYMCTMHTLDKVITCKSRNAKNEKPKSFNKNRLTMLSVLDKIRYKQAIRDALLKECNDGIYFYYFETTNTTDYTKMLSDIDVMNIVDINEFGVNCSIISLPVDYCKIVGKKNNSFVCAFDLKYFQQFNETDCAKKLKMFPKEIRDKWLSLKNKSTDKTWIVLDNNKTIIDKIKTASNEPWGVPISISALDDVLYSNYFTNTKRSILDSINSQIIYETFPEGEKGKCSLTGKQQEDQHNIVKSAVLNRSNQSGTSFFSLAAGSQLDSLKVDTSLLDEKNENAIKDDVSSDLGVASSILNGNAKGNFATASLNLELVAGRIYTMIENFITELNKCINANVIKDKRCIVECYILPTTSANRDKQVKYYADLYARGKGSLTAWISASGMDSDAYISLMDYELEMDYENKYPVHATSFTVSSKDGHSGDKDQSGAPKKENPTNENTIASQTNNGNNQPKPSK